LRVEDPDRPGAIVPRSPNGYRCVSTHLRNGGITKPDAVWKRERYGDRPLLSDELAGVGISMNRYDTRSRARGCLLGLAVGDALGAAVEFRERGSFPRVTEMTGGGHFRLRPGEWTDDTSMALCLGMSLIEVGGFDPRDQMDRYRRWYEEGYLSSTGECFDIGDTVRAALDRYRTEKEPNAGSTDPHTAGNGCIMRLAPVPLFYFPDVEAAERRSAASCRTTHGAEECVDASRLLARVLCRALRGDPKDAVLLGSRSTFRGAPSIRALARGTYMDKPEEEIRGTGYVVESLEAALWCFDRARSFEEAVLMAVNLGDDADTTGAITGQIAGAFYGEEAIPERWRDRLVMGREIAWLAQRLHDHRSAP